MWSDWTMSGFSGMYRMGAANVWRHGRVAYSLRALTPGSWQSDTVGAMSFRRAWRRFRTAPRTLGPTPGVREAWHRGRRWYHVWAVLVDDPVVLARRDAVAAAVAPWTTPFAADAPHVTVWVHGFDPPPVHPDEGRVVPLVVSGANAFTSCPFLEVRAPALRALRARFPGEEERWSAYLPHLTVARFHGAHPTPPLVAALRPFRALPPVVTAGRFVRVGVDAFDEAGRLVPAG